MKKTWFHTVAGLGAVTLLSFGAQASAAWQLTGLDVAYEATGPLPNLSTDAAAPPVGLDFVAGAGSRWDDIDLRFEPRGVPVVARLADDAHLAAAMRIAAAFSREQRAVAVRTARDAERARVALTAALGLVAPSRPEPRAVMFEASGEQVSDSFARASSDEATASAVDTQAPLQGADAGGFQAPLSTRGAFEPEGPLELSAFRTRKALGERALSAVPEPMPIALLAAGGLLLAAWRGRPRLRAPKESA